jgi:hypothetical protein
MFEGHRMNVGAVVSVVKKICWTQVALLQPSVAV